VLPKDRIGKKTFQPFCLFILDHGAPIAIVSAAAASIF
jgi:hypothetical protein